MIWTTKTYNLTFERKFMTFQSKPTFVWIHVEFSKCKKHVEGTTNSKVCFMLVSQKLARLVEFEFLTVDDSCTAGNFSLQHMLSHDIFTYSSSRATFLYHMESLGYVFEIISVTACWNDPSLIPKTTTKTGDHLEMPWITFQDEDRQAYLLCVEGSVQMVDAKGRWPGSNNFNKHIARGSGAWIPFTS